MPALLIKTVIGPSAASAASIALTIDAPSVTSIATAAARPPLAVISSSNPFSLPVWRAASATAAPCADSTRANWRPSPCEAPVIRMISLLTSNRPGMTNSAGSMTRIDTDDFPDRKPDSFTNIQTRGNKPGAVSHEQFRCRGLPRAGRCDDDGLQRRAPAQRGHDPGLSGRDADRGVGDVVDHPRCRRHGLDAESAAVLRDIFGRGHRARKAHAHGDR